MLGLSSILLFWTFVVPLLALIFGLLAARDIKRSGGTIGGSGKARAGTILGILGILGFAGIVVAGALGAFKTNKQAIDSLQIGSCYDLPVSGSKVSELTKIDCTKPHDGQAYFKSQLNPSGTLPYPGQTEASRQASTMCAGDEYTKFTGAAYPTHGLTVFTIVTDEVGWTSSKGRFTCFVTNADGTKLTTSVQGIAG